MKKQLLNIFNQLHITQLHHTHSLNMTLEMLELQQPLQPLHNDYPQDEPTRSRSPNYVFNIFCFTTVLLLILLTNFMYIIPLKNNLTNLITNTNTLVEITIPTELTFYHNLTQITIPTELTFYHNLAKTQDAKITALEDQLNIILDDVVKYNITNMFNSIETMADDLNEIVKLINQLKDRNM